MISFLVAMGRNRVIGKDNDLPWRLPEDLKFFKQVSMGKTIIMGRKTFESMNGPLPGRTNVVVTRNKDYEKEGCTVIHGIDEIYKWNEEQPEKEWLVIGGSHLFEQVINEADRMYITWIDEEFDGDTYFPEFDEKNWILTQNEKGKKDEKNPYDYYFRQYDRKT
ncbi:dihydrofolate reductase [Pontibacillus yanchengensis]|uniref:Dihydrofolate reductase n=1 Tax=Pontibacillus yanchengensis Y32 TaxID=1385514 RepID=A0A0A2T5N7_9BACI|nr:dihydrofolate reductase [Pontibacillus yanchengensis]KGP71117.1 dihydrofolate reductase [Pontibacillus yanchengensis Y32]